MVGVLLGVSGEREVEFSRVRLRRRRGGKEKWAIYDGGEVFTPSSSKADVGCFLYVHEQALGYN